MNPLFQPFTPGPGLVLKNRLVKAATSEYLADSQGNPGKALATLYGRWAQGGAGLMITGNLMVSRRYLEGAGNVVVDQKTDLTALTAWAGAAHAHGAGLIGQISHPGRQTSLFVAARPLAPSAAAAVKTLHAFGRPRAMGEAEILAVLDSYETAASRLKAAGFDGVQLHGAHGYLISQFLSPVSNQRADRWGGCLENRARFLLTLTRRLKDGLAADWTVSVKLNAGDFERGGFTQEEAAQVAVWLEEAGLDMLEISGGNYENPALYGAADQMTGKGAYFAGCAALIRENTRLPVMLTGGLRSAAEARQLLDKGTIDLVGLVRPLILDPDLPVRLRQGGDIPPTQKRSLGFKELDVLTETAWYGAQLGRLAKGSSPDPDMPLWPPVLAYLAEGAIKGLAWQAGHHKAY